jgi:hypothetical protein
MLSSVRPLPIAVILSVLWLGVTVQAQRSDSLGPSGSVKLSGGPGAQRVALEATSPPAPGDSITATATTNQAKIALITPRGQRITAQNAKAAGLDWSETPFNQPPPLGSEDGGRYASITFKRPGVAGRYVVEFAFPALKTTATAEARFTLRLNDYSQVVASVPGAQMPKPIKLAPSAIVKIELTQDEEWAAFDVLVPDPTVKVSLTLPDGSILRPGQPTSEAVKWKTVEMHGETDPLDSVLSPFFGLIPVDGTHHSIYLQKGAKGVYEIRATQSGNGGGELRVAFLPMLRFVGELRRRMEAAQLLGPGEVKIRFRPGPFECVAGDKVDLVVELLGDVGKEPPEFEVRMEVRARLGATKTKVAYSPTTTVETVPVKFTREADGAYHGSIVAAKPGVIRISVHASGKTASGRPFTAEALVVCGKQINDYPARREHA